MILPRLALAVPLAVLIVVTAGCGDGRKTVYPVTGKVLDANKKPAVGATVFLTPVSEDKADPPAAGTVDEAGNVKFTTYNEGDGAAAGEYNVTVIWAPARKTAKDPEVPDKLGGKYSNPRKSGIPKFTVKSDGPNELPAINLK